MNLQHITVATIVAAIFSVQAAWAKDVNAGAAVGDKCFAAKLSCDADALSRSDEFRAGYYLAMALNYANIGNANPAPPGVPDVNKMTSGRYLIKFERASIMSGGEPLTLCREAYNASTCARVKEALTMLPGDKRDY